MNVVNGLCISIHVCMHVFCMHTLLQTTAAQLQFTNYVWIVLALPQQVHSNLYLFIFLAANTKEYIRPQYL